MESHDPDDDRVVRHCQTFDHEMHSSFQVLVVADKEFRRRHRFHDCRPEETGATSATTTSTTTIPTTTTPTTPTTTTTEQPTTATTGTAACKQMKIVWNCNRSDEIINLQKSINLQAVGRNIQLVLQTHWSTMKPTLRTTSAVSATTTTSTPNRC